MNCTDAAGHERPYGDIMGQVSFHWKNLDFLYLRILICAIRNLDFLLKNVDFIIQTAGHAEPHHGRAMGHVYTVAVLQLG